MIPNLNAKPYNFPEAQASELIPATLNVKAPGSWRLCAEPPGACTSASLTVEIVVSLPVWREPARRPNPRVFS